MHHGRNISRFSSIAIDVITTLRIHPQVFYNKGAMGQALYRKYRSRNLQEIVGQEHVTTTLRNSLETGRISHAYLLTGPRGTGKTSIARILAHEINQLPYSEDPHLDIIEIDAASNRRIDEIRDLRDHVHNAPASARYKVYIIDEVHMLTKEAFNALLKTLEEPPAHVIFILATTEAHKLPETITSRTQRFIFRPVAEHDVVTHLKHIASVEKIAIDDEALTLIAEHGQGSFRDSISLLDQARSTASSVSAADIEHLLGRPPAQEINRLFETAASADLSVSLDTLAGLRAAGFEAAIIAARLGALIRKQMIQPSPRITLNYEPAVRLLSALVQVPAAHNPFLALELAVLEFIYTISSLDSQPSVPRTARDTGGTSAADRAAAGRSEQQSDSSKNAAGAKTVPAKAKEQISSAPQTETKPSGERSTTPKTDASDKKPPKNLSNVQADKADPAASDVPPPSQLKNDDLSKIWTEVLQDIKKTHNTLYGIARMATPVLEDGKLVLQLKFAFHQKRLSEPRNRDIISAAVAKYHSSPIEIAYAVGTPGTPAKHAAAQPVSAAAAQSDDNTLTVLTEVFGEVQPL